MAFTIFPVKLTRAQIQGNEAWTTVDGSMWLGLTEMQTAENSAGSPLGAVYEPSDLN